jgi:hypothetical protein
MKPGYVLGFRGPIYTSALRIDHYSTLSPALMSYMRHNSISNRKAKEVKDLEKRIQRLAKEMGGALLSGRWGTAWWMNASYEANSLGWQVEDRVGYARKVLVQPSTGRVIEL